MGEPVERWRLIDLVIDVGAQTVVRGADMIAVPRLSFQFLLELLRAAPNVLSVDELMERVWPGVFVNSETVTQRAKLLRDALSDDPKEPRYFIARRGIGYQLLAEPKRLVDVPESGGKTRRSLRWKAALAAISMVPLAGMAYFGYDMLTGAAAQSEDLRVAVLPFDNLSSDPSDAYIAQGIPEMVLNRLSSIPGLAVISKESALLGGSKSADTAVVIKQLDADYVVKGSVQKRDQSLRVTSFVFDSRTGARIWSKKYDWPLNRLYALQDQIAGEISQALAARTSRGLRLVGTSRQAANSDSYLAFLKGKALLGRMRVADTEAAAEQFLRAINLDPSFAPAMVALFDARMQAATLRSDDLAPVRERYGSLLDRARTIDPRSGPLLYAEAMWSNLPREERLLRFKQAAERDPSNSRGLVAWAQFLEWGGMDGPPTQEAKQIMDRVMSIDPLSADAQFWAVQRDVANRTPEDIEAAQRRALALDPENILLANRYAVRRWRLGGQTAEAIGLIERIISSDPAYARNAHMALAMYLDVGDLSAARAVASSTPGTRDSSRTILALYNGDWRSAGEAALGTRGFLFNHFENWLWAEAVRDFALKAGQLDRGAEAIATRYGFDLSSPQVTSLYQLPASVPLAQILIAQGKTELAHRLLSQAVRWLDEHPKLGLGGGTGRAKAGALMLLGQRDQALSVLLATTRGAHDIRQCWYLVRQDPVWAPVRSDPRFQEIVGVCSESQRTQRALLEAMRSAGKVQRRAG